VSAIIQAITPVASDTATNPSAGSITQATSGQTFVDTDGTGVVNIVAPSSGAINTASGTTGANLTVTGDGTAGITYGTATDANGGLLDGSGSIFQVAEDYQGTVVANLDGAIVGNANVNVNATTTDGSSIASNASGIDVNDLDHYVNTGKANDQVQGSGGKDFIRTGAGDDVFNAGGGDDIVRAGAGDDSGSLGNGNDTFLLTVDQMQGESVNTITDFDAAGNDKIAIDKDLEKLVEIDGIGTKAITITLSGAQTGVTGVVSKGETIDEDDIEFV